MTETDVKELANIIYHEARGESRRGQIAVGHVVLNRVADPRYPNTVKGVAWQRFQFSNLRYHNGWRRFEQMARDLLSGNLENPVGRALSFRAFSHRKARIRIGNHWFW
ncbi:MAG: hypothetical protein CMB99_00150 [Flavobacteriaceae bacterium]|nr:hypothetical protein [Flavobacteriaceae bacterium]